MAAQPPPVNPYQDFIEKDRKAYFLNLVYQQRVPMQQAMQMTFEKFGPPKTQQELAKDKASQEQKSGIAQTVGSLAGMYGASKVASLFGGGSAAAGSAGAAGAGGAGAAGAAGTAGTSGGFLSSIGSLFGGGGSAAGAGSAGAGTAGTAGASTLSAAPILPIAAALALVQSTYERGGKQILKGKAKKEDWANLPAGGLNIGLKLLGKRSFGRMITGGKSDAQEMRDMFRKDLRDEEIADKDWNVTLADGTKYNIGLDGKAKLQNVGENIDKKTTRRMWDVDFSNPLAKKAVDLVNAKVMERYGGIKGVAPEQFTGMLVNAITSNAKNEQDLMANYNSVLGKSSFAGGQLAPTVNPQALVRPKKGEVLRVSPGLYRTDTGRLQQGSSMRQALERAYKKGK